MPCLKFANYKMYIIYGFVGETKTEGKESWFVLKDRKESLESCEGALNARA